MSAAYLIAFGGKIPEPRTSETLRAFYQSLLDPLMAEAKACGWEGCAFSSVKMAGERVKIEIVPGDGVLTVDGMRAFHREQQRKEREEERQVA